MSRSAAPWPTPATPGGAWLWRWSAWLRLLTCLSLLGLAACSHRPTLPEQQILWSGRLGLQVSTEPAQSFSANFELSGQAQAGLLEFFSPLGSQLASLRWQPGQATLRTAEETRTGASVDELMSAYLGTSALPLSALFDWLEGREHALQGWQVDLSQSAQGRLQAHRLAPAPAVQLRIVLDR